MPTVAKDVKMVIALLQLPMTAIVVAISVKDSTAMKVGVFLQGEKKEKGLVKPLLLASKSVQRLRQLPREAQRSAVNCMQGWAAPND